MSITGITLGLAGLAAGTVMGMASTADAGGQCGVTRHIALQRIATARFDDQATARMDRALARQVLTICHRR